MQFSKATLVAVLAALIQAQSISELVGQIPSCAVSCLTTAIGDSGCALTDYVCQCTNPGHDTILAKGAGCISAACSTSDTLSMSTSPMIINPVEKLPNCGCKKNELTALIQPQLMSPMKYALSLLQVEVQALLPRPHQAPHLLRRLLVLLRPP